MRDDVVQLARDARPLLADGRALALELLALEQRQALRACAVAAAHKPRRGDDQAGREQEALGVHVSAGDHGRPESGDADARADQRPPVLGMRAERVESDGARGKRRKRRRLAVEQSAAEGGAQRGGCGEDACDGERRAAARAEREREQQPAADVDEQLAATLVVAQHHLRHERHRQRERDQRIDHAGVAQAPHATDGSGPCDRCPRPL